jgi:hypothetical protein
MIKTETDLSRAHGMPTSVNQEANSGGEGCLVGGQKRDGRGHLGSLAGSAESMSLLAAFQKLKN